VGGLNEQRTEVDIALFGDRKAGVTVSGLATARGEPKIGADIPAAAETRMVGDGEDECERGDRSDTRHLLDSTGMRKLLSDETFDLVVHLGDTKRKESDRLDQRGEGWP
jgi:hypothetical protein